MRVGMPGGFQDLPGTALQYDFTGIHDNNPITDTGNRAEIMTDVKHRHIAVTGQITEQFQNMRLGGDIEAGGRLIKQQRIRLARQGHSNGDTLLLAT